MEVCVEMCMEACMDGCVDGGMVMAVGRMRLALPLSVNLAIRLRDLLIRYNHRH